MSTTDDICSKSEFRNPKSEIAMHAGAQVLRERGAGEEMEAVLALFASFVMSPEEIRQIVRWEMAVLRESPWYQEIVQEGFLQGRQAGIQEGIQEGRQEGIQEGIQKGLVEAVLHLLRARFEPPDSTVERLTLQLQKVGDVEVLRRLLVAAATAEDLDHFQAVLERPDGFADAEAGAEGQSEDPAHP
ncbi:MAG: hypothetical protein ACE5LU_20410 [Anaerolineae bacterium]